MPHRIKVEITRFVDDHFPGFVECRLIDALQREWFFIEKVPVVTLQYLDSNSTYPSQGEIACHVVGKRTVGNQETICVDTSEPWHIESVSGETRFEVFAEQLTAGHWH